MYRYTTPTIAITFDEGVDLTAIAVMNVNLEQDDVTIQKELEDLTISGQVVSFSLTQEETAAFSAGKVLIQAHYKTTSGTVVATNTKLIDVKDVLDEEVI